MTSHSTGKTTSTNGVVHDRKMCFQAFNLYLMQIFSSIYEEKVNLKVNILSHQKYLSVQSDNM